MEKHLKLFSIISIILCVLVFMQTVASGSVLLRLSHIESQLAAGVSSSAGEDTAPGVLVSPIPVEIASSPYEGSINAPVVIVEFSDFECVYCKAVQPKIQELKKQYGDNIKHVFRNYPVASIHPGSVGASVAALCAKDQGKFWEYHSKLFEKANGSGSLSNDLLKESSLETGLNQVDFDNCFDSRKYLGYVQKDFEDGTQ